MGHAGWSRWGPGAGLGAEGRRVVPGVGQGRVCRAGLPNQCCKLAPRPPLTGDFPSFPANGRQSPAPKVKPRSAEKGQGRARPVPGRAAEGRRELRRGGGRRRKAGGGGVEEPGPGSLPAYCTRKWRFPWVPERKKQSLGSPPPLFLSPPPPRPFACCCSTSLRRRPHRSRASLRRWANTFSSLSCFPWVYLFFICTICFRFPAILQRGCLSWGFFGGVRGRVLLCLWVQNEEDKYLRRRRGRLVPRLGRAALRGRGSRAPTAGLGCRALSFCLTVNRDGGSAGAASLLPGCSGALMMRLCLGELPAMVFWGGRSGLGRVWGFSCRLFSWRAACRSQGSSACAAAAPDRAVGLGLRGLGFSAGVCAGGGGGEGFIR